MNLFDELKQIGIESHEVWFKRYFNNLHLEDKLRVSAKKGYSSFRIYFSKAKDDYKRRRLNDDKTVEALKERLGKGFVIKCGDVYSFGFAKKTSITDRYISIEW